MIQFKWQNAVMFRKSTYKSNPKITGFQLQKEILYF